MPSGRKKPSPAETPRGTRERALGTRERALTVAAEDLDLAPIGARPYVWGAIMELRYPQAVATLAVFADGTASLYVSRGSGALEAGEHAAVRKAADTFLWIADAHVAYFKRAEETPVPQQGRVRFYVRTFRATLTADADEQDLVQNRHMLSALFHAGHVVITQMRLMSERPSK